MPTCTGPVLCIALASLLSASSPTFAQSVLAASPSDSTPTESATVLPSFTTRAAIIADTVEAQSADRQRVIIAVSVTLAVVLLLCIGVVLFLKVVAARRNRSQTSPPLPTTMMPARVLTGLQFDERTFYRHIAATKGG